MNCLYLPSNLAMPLLAGVLLPVIGYEGIFWATGGMILLSMPFALGIKVVLPAAPQALPVAAE